MAELVTNPPTSPQQNGALASFFGFLGSIATPLVQGKLQNEMNESAARSAARVQQTLNQYHAVDPSLGANDPKAAQKAANKTFLERFLPSSMLYQEDAMGNRTPAIGYYVIMGLLVIALIWGVKRLFK